MQFLHSPVSSRFGLKVLLALIFVLAIVGITASDTSAQDVSAPLYLKAGKFSPTAGERLPLPAGLTILPTESAKSASSKSEYYIVQFRGPVRENWKQQVTDTGAFLHGYIPDNAFKVRATPQQMEAISKLGAVVYTGVFEPGYKLSPTLARGGETQLYRVEMERRFNFTLEALQATGAQLVSDNGRFVYVSADAAQLFAIARIPDVAYIEPFTLKEKHGDSGEGVIIGANVANASGYDGSTQTVAVADTGIGGGTAATAHADIPASRVAQIYNLPGTAGGCFQTIVNDGAADAESGHGTHTTGSVLSDGNANGIGKGAAPAARLVFQAVENFVKVSSLCRTEYGYYDGYYLTGIPGDLHTLFQQAYDAGARIHSNSWGSAAEGDYTTDSANADDFVWNNQDFVITFSAGNNGVDANSNGIVDNDSINSPATAKNVITVGASENARTDNYPCDTSLKYQAQDDYHLSPTCGSMGGQNAVGTYGSHWPGSFGANPIAGDSAAGNPEQMAAFSSRGPADDTRIKPDLVAPGTWILSTSSSLYQQGYGDPINPQTGGYAYDGWGMPYNADYKYMGGTSMSNPIVAGAAAVVKDYYSKAKGINASAALVKATLINSAVDLLDENNDGSNDNDFPIPNVHEGWGRVNLTNATDNSFVYVDNSAGLATGGNSVTNYTTPGGQPFKVSLVWTDYASTAAASVNLVNNLNLTVTSPDGVTYRGNVFSGGWAATGGTADARNNVENVYVKSAAAGTWTVTVNGANVPSGPQPFALVVDGTSSAQTVATPTVPVSPTYTSTATGVPPTAKPTNTPQATSVPPTVKPTKTPKATVVPPTAKPTKTPKATSVPPTAAPTNQPLPAGDTGWLSPSTEAAQTSGDGNGYQTNAINAYADDGTFAVDTLSGSNTNGSCPNAGKDKHSFNNYGVSIPGGVIDGIQVRLDAQVDAAVGAPKLCVQLSWDGGKTWTAAKQTSTLTTSEATYTLGATTQNWGHKWTTANLTNANFRLRVSNVATNVNRAFSLDWVALRVTYH